MPARFIPHVPTAGKEQHLSWKTQPSAGVRQEFGFQSHVSHPAAFIINAIIEQHEEHPIFSVSKKHNSSEIKS